MKSSSTIRTTKREIALLVQVVSARESKDAAADSLLELERLADTAGAVVAGSITQRRNKPTPAYFVGKGKVDDIRLACERSGANLVIIDNDLSAIQVNNLDLSLGIKVIDRTELILQIFARRARSSEAQIQVELAQLRYLVSRIPVSEKQQRFQGGIGMRGPGESPLRLRNEPMRRRIKDLEKKLEGIRARREQTRRRRRWPKICLVGYTNAGKSTLLNAFAQSDAYVDDRLFATLDTTTRLIRLEKGTDVLLTDTVGFIRNLPHGLIASFRSTLEVAAEADLLLLVADAGHPHMDEHLVVVRETLNEIGAAEVPRIVVLNKCDTPDGKQRLAERLDEHPRAVPVSALHREGLDRLKQRIQASIENAVSGHNPHR